MQPLFHQTLIGRMHEGDTAKQEQSLAQFQQVTKELAAKIQSDPDVTYTDKISMAKTIESINKKMEGLASKSDVETITSSMKDLINEGKITRGKLQDLEDDIDDISARQDKTDERVNKLEQFQQATEALTDKIQSDTKISDKNKVLMARMIEYINKKM